MTIHFDKLDTDLGSASAPCGIVRLPARPGLYRNGVKRVFDALAIILMLPIVIPAIVVLALLVARDGQKPFYWSKRVGKDGREFNMLKLRTMVPDADRRLEEHLSRNGDARIEWDSTQKLKNDPRITRIGRLLRKTSLDELPQLWNVLIGEMSLVGPRPMLPQQRALYPGLAYFALRPGITGSWQVSDRNECEFARRAFYDKNYDDRLSFRTDMSLILKTFGVVLKGTGY